MRINKTRMSTETKQQTITIPVTGLTYLHKSERNPDRMVCEIDMALLGTVNEQDVIDMMIREAQRDYEAGNYKTAHNADELIAGLRGAYEN